ncbi:hypothetical protein BJM39_29570 [Salmonella enterica subsp. enterica serovar Javiana]|nr:hypothetical protein BJM39_29570 [Salmonella enterica subsp. enterica serovar Javiana]
MSRTVMLPVLARTAFTGVLLAVALTGCVAKTPEIPKATTPSTTTPSVDYPIAIQRFGGVAGFSDTVNIDVDRSVLAKVNKQSLSCTLDEASFAAVTKAAVTVGDSGNDSTPTMAHADDMLVLLNNIPTTDDRIKDVEPVVTALLEDLAKPKAKRTVCR